MFPGYMTISSGEPEELEERTETVLCRDDTGTEQKADCKLCQNENGTRRDAV